MAESGENMLKKRIQTLNNKGIQILLTRDIHNNGFRLDAIKGSEIKTKLVQPWVASSANWEWLMIREIDELVKEF